MFATERGTRPKTRKALTVGAAGPITKLHFSSSNTDSITALRVQFLSRRGIANDRARLIAALLFGEAA